LRLEYFLSLLRHARFIIGNSSAGIREAPVYGVYSISIGDRQNNRYRHLSILCVPGTAEAIRGAFRGLAGRPPPPPSFHFGRGDSASRFRAIVSSPAVWCLPKQKQFVTIGSLTERGRR
jgi:UDP-N-acetylglucosamine 2-epimerase (hydrolysing)